MKDDSIDPRVDVLHKSIQNPEPVTVLGLGAVGRYIALLLVAQGVRRLRLVDDAFVRSADVRHAGFSTADIGRSRADAVLGSCYELEPMLLDAEPIYERPSRSRLTTGPVFCCSDNQIPSEFLNSESRSYPFWGAVVAERERLAIHCGTRSTVPTKCAVSHRSDGPFQLPLYAAMLAAALLIRQYLRHLEGSPLDPFVTFDLQSGACVVGTPRD